MANKLGNFALKKSEGWMEGDKIINYKSQRSMNNQFYSIESNIKNKTINFCLVKDKISNLDVSCIVNFFQHGKNSDNLIFQKAGKFYEDNFNSKLLKILPSLSINSHSIFLSLSGEMINCEFILNVIYKCKNNQNNSEKEIFLRTFEIYADMFESANKSKLKSLAVPLILIENERDISLKALTQAIIYLTESLDSNDQSLKNIYFVSEDDKVLKKFDNLTKNGFDLDYLIFKNEKYETNKTVVLRKTKNFQNFYNICDICGKDSLLLSNFLNDEFMENCSKFNRKCKICNIGKKIALFYKSKSPANGDTFCIYCVGDFIDKIKYSICSSCLRKTDRLQMKNKYCEKDLVCLKCNNLPENIKNCYICEFFVLSQKFEEKKIILDHDKISCCFDYCNLSEINYENIHQLSCGHTSCSKIASMSKLCSLCAISRLLESLSNTF